MPLTSPHIYLAKANDDLVSHCRCAEALITFPPQMNCPWCGCGWLFTCITCRKAFTFAKGVEVSESWEDLATRDISNRGVKSPTQESASGWVAAMKELLADVEVGKEYVCLDGLFIPVDASSVNFVGWHSRHSLPFVPQVAAKADPSIVKSFLANRVYWEQNAAETAGA